MTDRELTANGGGLQLNRVLGFPDLLVYGMVYVAPIGPWSLWAFASRLAGLAWLALGVVTYQLHRKHRSAT